MSKVTHITHYFVVSLLPYHFRGACLSMCLQEDYTTDEEALAAHGVKGGAGGILDLLKASKQVAGLDSGALRLDLSIVH